MFQIIVHVRRALSDRRDQILAKMMGMGDQQQMKEAMKQQAAAMAIFGLIGIGLIRITPAVLEGLGMAL